MDKHGDILPIIGGPLDGETREVMRCPFLPWVPDLFQAGFSTEDRRHWYVRAGKAWVYKGAIPEEVKRGE